MLIQRLKHAFACIALLASILCFQCIAHADDERYIITLRPVAVVAPEIVRLGDIADIDGPSDVVVEALQGLDLQDAPESGATLTITKAQVDIRLKLAKAPPGRILVKGERTVVGLNRPNARDSERDSKAKVTRIGDAKSTSNVRQVSAFRAAAAEASERTSLSKSARDVSDQRDRVAAVAKHAVLNRLPWNPEDVEIEATHVGARADELSDEQLERLSAELRSAWPPLGRVQVVVNVPGKGVAEPGIPVVLNVKYFQNIVVTKRAIEMGRTIQPEDLYVDRREVRELGVNWQSASDVVGRISTRPIAGLQPVRVGDVKSTLTAAVPVPGKVIDKTPAIRRGDTVQLVALGGPLSISIMAKAQQDGQIGDVIRLENTDSKKVVTGKVVGKNQVEVAY